MAETLHLRAEDVEDLAVVSSCLQDALVPLRDMRYERDGRRFILAVNRFRWEACEPHASGEYRPDAVFERIACGIIFNGVRHVRIRGIDQARRDRLLELLAIVTSEAAVPGRQEDRPAAEEAREEGTAILLVFAGGGVIQLDVDKIHCRLEDFGESWPTRWRPRHRLEPEGAAGG